MNSVICQLLHIGMKRMSIRNKTKYVRSKIEARIYGEQNCKPFLFLSRSKILDTNLGLFDILSSSSVKDGLPPHRKCLLTYRMEDRYLVWHMISPKGSMLQRSAREVTLDINQSGLI